MNICDTYKKEIAMIIIKFINSNYDYIEFNIDFFSAYEFNIKLDYEHREMISEKFLKDDDFDYNVNIFNSELDSVIKKIQSSDMDADLKRIIKIIRSYLRATEEENFAIKYIAAQKFIKFAYKYGRIE